MFTGIAAVAIGVPLASSLALVVLLFVRRDASLAEAADALSKVLAVLVRRRG